MEQSFGLFCAKEIALQWWGAHEPQVAEDQNEAAAANHLLVCSLYITTQKKGHIAAF